MAEPNRIAAKGCKTFLYAIPQKCREILQVVKAGGGIHRIRKPFSAVLRHIQMAMSFCIKRLDIFKTGVLSLKIKMIKQTSSDLLNSEMPWHV
jgi:hypothetical protein